jgi:hypothetical protein
MDLIELAQVRERGPVLMSALMKIQVPQNEGNFFD